MKHIIACLLALLTLCGCSTNTAIGTAPADSSAPSTQAPESSALQISPENTSATAKTDMFTARDKEVGYDESQCTAIFLNKNTADISGDGAAISGSVITISGEGSYIISGQLDNGQIVIDADKAAKIHLILSGAELNSSSSAPLYIKQCDKTFITLAKDSQNTLSNDGEFVTTDENNLDAALFSKEDLSLNGTGYLTVTSAAGHGIVSKDDLVFTGGSYSISATGHSMAGKDSVRIAAGSFVLTSGKDGIHAENTDNTALGFIYIENGQFTIKAESDGLDAGAALQITGGEFDITSGGGSANASVKSDGSANPGWGAWSQEDTTPQAQEQTAASAKGIKSAAALTISGGQFTIDSSDDALHANADLTVEGGSLIISSGDDGLHADNALHFSQGRLTIHKSYEGIEGQSITVSGGTIDLTASDDGLNAAGGSDQSALNGRPGMGNFSADSNAFIKVSGGILTIDASGDGIDSNGDLEVSGGEIYLWGPESNGNGALDYAGEAIIAGGVLLGSGSSGMAQNFGQSSTQGVILASLAAAKNAGTEVILSTADGTEIATFQPAKGFDSLIISSPQITAGQSYTLSVGGDRQTITMGSLIYGTGGMGGMGGGMEKNRPGGNAPAGERPQENGFPAGADSLV